MVNAQSNVQTLPLIECNKSGIIPRTILVSHRTHVTIPSGNSQTQIGDYLNYYDTFRYLGTFLLSLVVLVLS